MSKPGKQGGDQDAQHGIAGDCIEDIVNGGGIAHRFGRREDETQGEQHQPEANGDTPHVAPARHLAAEKHDDADEDEQ